MMNKKVLIIGGNGYIGSQLYEYLEARGFTTHIRDINWWGWVHKGYNVSTGDYRDLDKFDIDFYTHIVLLAGHSSVSMCKNNLSAAISNNLSNFSRLISTLMPWQRLIYASTAAVYEHNPDGLSKESDSVSVPRNEYDYTYINRDIIPTQFVDNDKIVGIRFGSVNGFSKNIRSENLLNSLTLNSIEKNEMVVSNGDKYRAVLGINDLCRAVETLINADVVPHKLYNLVSVNDTIENFGKTIQELSGAELIVSDKFKTDFSFRCSTELFENDFNFKFVDTTASIYKDIVYNYKKILYRYQRGPIYYASY